jgi:maltooligosyltrehalose trehalohydrolase
VLCDRAFLLRFFTEGHKDDRLLIVNLGGDIMRPSIAEPLLAPISAAHNWAVSWSSEDPAYGGGGTPEFLALDYADRATANEGAADYYAVAGECAIVLAPCPRQAQREGGIQRRTA